jgi:hypothetical protein
MSHLTATAPARAFRDRVDSDHADHTDQGAGRNRSRMWTLIEALAYAGAHIDPSGILAVERLRQAKEAEERRVAS